MEYICFSCTHRAACSFFIIHITAPLLLQLQAYALEEMSNGMHLGYSSQGCTTDTAIVSRKYEIASVHIYRFLYVVGFIFLVIFDLVASALLLQVLLKTLSQKMEACRYSFEYYGIFWGMSAVLFPILLLLLYSDISQVALVTFNPNVHQTKCTRFMWPFVLASPMAFCAPVAIYFGVKFKLAAPSVYLLPAKLLCCCNRKRAGILVTSLTLWFDLAAANFIIGHCVYVLYAFLVAPFVVAVNVMLLMLTFMCLTYIMAALFTVCASFATRKCLRSNADCCATVRAVMLIPLLLTIICFSSTVALSNQFVNSATRQNSFHILLKSIVGPVLLAVVSLNLKRFVSAWLYSSSDSMEDGNTVNPPPYGQVYNGYQDMDSLLMD